MPRVDLEQSLIPSVLDRLIDPDSGGTHVRRGYGVDRMVKAVRRDLEDILNTRLSQLTLPEEYVELKQSPLNYGLPDFGSLPTTTKVQHQSIGRRLEEAINRFEPRLRDVRVRLVEDRHGSHQLTARYQVEARLAMDPFPDISFETVLELTTGNASIKANKA